MQEIRRLTVSDRAAAAVLTQQFADADAPPGDLAAWLAVEAHVMIGAWIDDEAAGMAYGHHLPRPDGRPDMLLLYSIDVAPAFRGRGVGTALVRAFGREARGAMWLVTNTSNADAMAMYARTGGQRPHQDDAMFVFARDEC